MMKHCVLLTRPEGSNDGLCRLLKQRGISCLVRPMLEILPIEIEAMQKTRVMNLDQFDSIIFVSGNAVRLGVKILEQYWPQWPQLDWFAVGESTSRELDRFDIQATYPEQAGSEALLSLSQLKSIAGRQVLIVRGRGGRELLAEELTARGAKVSYLETYERIEIHYGEALAAALFEHRVDLGVVTSAQSLKHLCSSLSAREIDTLHLVVPSARIAKLARQLAFPHVQEADGAADEALLQAILRVTLLLQTTQQN